MASTTDVVLPIATLILGYAGSLFTEARRDRRLAEREAKARLDEAERIRAERKADFQRESLLALQDAIAAFGPLSRGDEPS